MFDSGHGSRRPQVPAEGPRGEHCSELDGPPVVHVDQFATMRPGGDLAVVMEDFDPTVAGDEAVLEAIAALDRLSSWAYAMSARVAAELASRPSMNPDWDERAGAPAQPCVAGDEIAMRLGCSRRAGARLVRDGRVLAGPLAWTADALIDGELDRVKARILIDRLETVALPVALEVQDQVLGRAAGRTPTQLRRDVERALLSADPVDAQARHAHARAGRQVHAPRVLADGMAGIWAVLPAQDAVRVHATLDAAARTVRDAGDSRTVDQLRADGLVDLVLGSAGALPTGVAPPAGVGATGSRPVPPRTQVSVTVGLSTLLGTDEAPGELSGYGPISADQARALAAGGVWRRLVTDPLSGAVLDVGRTRYRPPAALVEHVRARDRYCARPGCSAIAEGCDIDHTQGFHQPHGQGGSTAVDNLGPLCRRDHRLKTDGGHVLVQTSPGSYVWTTPTGQHYAVVPGADEPVDHLNSRGRHRSRNGQPPPPF